MHGSVRTCVGCRRRAEPAELIRIVRSGDGTLTTGRGRPGRGAWLCRGVDTQIDPTCLEAAIRRQALSRALRAPVGAQAMEALRAEGTKRARIEEGRD